MARWLVICAHATASALHHVDELSVTSRTTGGGVIRLAVRASNRSLVFDLEPAPTFAAGATIIVHGQGRTERLSAPAVRTYAGRAILGVGWARATLDSAGSVRHALLHVPSEGALGAHARARGVLLVLERDESEAEMARAGKGSTRAAPRHVLRDVRELDAGGASCGTDSAHRVRTERGPPGGASATERQQLRRAGGSMGTVAREARDERAFRAARGAPAHRHGVEGEAMRGGGGGGRPAAEPAPGRATAGVDADEIGARSHARALSVLGELPTGPPYGRLSSCPPQPALHDLRLGLVADRGYVAAHGGAAATVDEVAHVVNLANAIYMDQARARARLDRPFHRRARVAAAHQPPPCLCRAAPARTRAGAPERRRACDSWSRRSS